MDTNGNNMTPPQHVIEHFKKQQEVRVEEALAAWRPYFEEQAAKEAATKATQK